MNTTSTHLHLVQEAQRTSNLLATQPVVLDGSSLDITSVVEVARNGVKVEITKDSAVLQGVQDSLDFLATKKGVSIYGVTTGFGGSADTRTSNPEALQLALLEHQLCGVLPIKGDVLNSVHMPEEIVRGAMCIRINSLLRGHSSIRLSVLESMAKFLNLNITPLVPLRTSISASGDLSPLAYIAACLCGHPDLRVIDRSSGEAVIKSCVQALEENNMEKVRLLPKEGLALINGTAYSAAAAALAMYDAHHLALLSQVVTALTTEAMVGMKGSYHPFIHDVCRPHIGQIEVAANIRNMLSSSKLAVEEEEDVAVEYDKGILRQDRYPLRTSPQFTGPNIESLMLAHSQISTELNTTTDNPLIESSQGFHHGGNFMAMSTAVAVESIRSSLQLLGRLSFAQMTEMLNCGMNRGLPSCLAGSEPSTNYHCKGLDIAAAAYTAELGFLSNSQVAHFQSAEMHNQAVNTMALASARRTIEANEVLGLLLSSHLYAACQAIDLRVLDLFFRAKVAKIVVEVATAQLAEHISTHTLKATCTTVVDLIMRRLDQTTSTDLLPRVADAFDFGSSAFVDQLAYSNTANPLLALQAWKKECSRQTLDAYTRLREQLLAGELDIASHLGSAKGLYNFVRSTIAVQVRKGDVESGSFSATIGSSVSKVVEGLKTPAGRDALLSCFGSVKVNGFH